MQARGYSLIEVLVAVGIASILLAIAVPRFTDYLTRYRTEAQTRLMYDELLRTRANALYQRRKTLVKFYPDRFEAYSSAAEGSEVAPIAVQLLRYPIEINVTGAVVEFDERGITWQPRSICIAGGEGTGAVDSVVIAETRVSIGKKDRGNECNSGNITKK
jgi:prepilin-type N-terminal cleavage/methylation domain-containing protein